jgi:hypothetical protein
MSYDIATWISTSEVSDQRSWSNVAPTPVAAEGVAAKCVAEHGASLSENPRLLNRRLHPPNFS